MFQLKQEKVYVRTFAEELRWRFGCRVHKIPVHVGMTCPNRDGTIGTGGCTFCGPAGSAAGWANPEMSVSDQLIAGIAYAKRRFKAGKFIAYFQPYTNTYASLRRLDALWSEALGVRDVVGLSIGTRPDCLPNEILDRIRFYREILPYLCLEVGLQTIHDQTLRRIRRGHNFDCFADAVCRAQAREIPLCVHIILGLPGETERDMLETVQVLLDMGIQGIKLHHLHIIRGSALEKEYRRGLVPLLTREEYVRLVCKIVRKISGRMVIHRFMGEAPPDLLVAPAWTGNKREVTDAIRKELRKGVFLDDVPSSQSLRRNLKTSGSR